MLAQRLRRWSNIEPAWVQRLVFAGHSIILFWRSTWEIPPHIGYVGNSCQYSTVIMTVYKHAKAISNRRVILDVIT